MMVAKEVTRSSFSAGERAAMLTMMETVKLRKVMVWHAPRFVHVKKRTERATI